METFATKSLWKGHTMTPDQKRIAIATACGWTDIRRQRLYLGDQDWWGTKLKGAEKHRNRLPDYLTDLNAMHEAEQVLTHDQRIDYMEWLGLSSDDHWYKVWAYVHATSAERCTAFIRTFGLWEKEGNTTKSASSTSPITEESSVVGNSGNETDFVTKSTQLNHND